MPTSALITKMPEWTGASTDRFKIVAAGQKVPAAGSGITYVQGFDFITPAFANGRTM
jgi:hypothetical protein